MPDHVIDSTLCFQSLDVLSDGSEVLCKVSEREPVHNILFYYWAVGWICHIVLLKMGRRLRLCL